MSNRQIYIHIHTDNVNEYGFKNEHVTQRKTVAIVIKQTLQSEYISSGYIKETYTRK